MASEERFGYEWDRYGALDSHYEEQLKRWFGSLESSFVRGRRILDAGCGMGRNSYWCLTWGAGSILAFDNDDRTVDAARKTLATFSNAEVKKENIYDIMYHDEFDLVFSIGVVHHLAHPEKAIENFRQALKPGGVLLVWLYGYEGNEWVLKILDPVRMHITSKLPPRLLHVLTYAVSVPFWGFLHFVRPRGEYYTLLRGFHFWHVHSIIFDQLLPTIAKYYTKEEARMLLERAGLTNVTVTEVNKKSWSVTGTKPA